MWLCLIPLAAVLLFGGAGFGRNWYVLLGIGAMVLCHAVMMRGGHHGGHGAAPPKGDFRRPPPSGGAAGGAG